MRKLVLVAFIILSITAKAFFKKSDDLTVKELVEMTNNLIALELPNEELVCSREDEKLEMLCLEYQEIFNELGKDTELEAVRQKFVEEEAVILRQLRKSAMDNFMECIISDPHVTSGMIPSIKVNGNKKDEANEKEIVDYWEQPIKDNPLSKLSFFGKCFKSYWLENLRGYRKHCKSKRLKLYYSQLIGLFEEPKKSKLHINNIVQGPVTIAIAGGVFMSGLVISLIVLAIALKIRVEQKNAAAEQILVA